MKKKLKQSNHLYYAFDINFVFSRWTLGDDFLTSIGVSESEMEDPSLNVLSKLAFLCTNCGSNDYICGTMTVEGAPHLKDEHLPVFDCASKCGRTGTRLSLLKVTSE